MKIQHTSAGANKACFFDQAGASPTKLASRIAERKHLLPEQILHPTLAIGNFQPSLLVRKCLQRHMIHSMPAHLKAL